MSTFPDGRAVVQASLYTLAPSHTGICFLLRTVAKSKDR